MKTFLLVGILVAVGFLFVGYPLITKDQAKQVAVCFYDPTSHATVCTVAPEPDPGPSRCNPCNA